jgi:hypothetical protein
MSVNGQPQPGPKGGPVNVISVTKAGRPKFSPAGRVNPADGTGVSPNEGFAEVQHNKERTMQPNNTSNIENTRELLEADLDIVVGGIAASQAWVSPAAIHGFNPQPDPPAIWASQTLPGKTGHA